MAKKRIHKCKLINCGVYQTRIKIIVTNDYKYSWNKETKGADWDTEISDRVKEAAAFMVYGDYSGVMMFDIAYLNPGIIGHESFHMTHAIMGDTGHTIEQGDEPHAYLCEWLITETHRALKDWKIRIKVR